MSVGLKTASAYCDDCLKVHNEIALALLSLSVHMVLVCCCPGCPQSQLDVEESTVTVERDRFVRPGSCCVRVSEWLFDHSSCINSAPSNSFLWPLLSLRRLSFTPARFLLSLRFRERYCHALYVSAVPVGGCFQTRDGLHRST